MGNCGWQLTNGKRAPHAHVRGVCARGEYLDIVDISWVDLAFCHMDVVARGRQCSKLGTPAKHGKPLWALRN